MFKDPKVSATPSLITLKQHYLRSFIDFALTKSIGCNATISRKKSTSKESKGKEKFEVCTIEDCMIDPCKPEPAVVIIGAGVAGLSAAHRLSQCGLTNYTILEAKDRYQLLPSFIEC